VVVLTSSATGGEVSTGFRANRAASWFVLQAADDTVLFRASYSGFRADVRGLISSVICGGGLRRISD
jgi:hypothetical protein